MRRNPEASPRVDKRGWGTLLGAGAVAGGLLIGACSGGSSPEQQFGQVLPQTPTSELSPADLQQLAAEQAGRVTLKLQASVNTDQTITLYAAKNSCLAMPLSGGIDAVIKNPTLVQEGGVGGDELVMLIWAQAATDSTDQPTVQRGAIEYSPEALANHGQKYDSFDQVEHSNARPQLVTIQDSFNVNQDLGGQYPTAWLTPTHSPGDQYDVTRLVPADHLNDAFPGVCIFTGDVPGTTPPSTITI